MISLGNHFNMSKEYSSAILSYFMRFYAFFSHTIWVITIFICIQYLYFLTFVWFSSFLFPVVHSVLCMSFYIPLFFFLTLVQLQWNKISKVKLFLLKENSGVHDCHSSISWKPMWMLLQCSCVVERRIKGLLTLSFELIKFLFQRKIWTTI